MSLKKINPRTTMLILFIVVTGLLRVMSAGKLLSPIANFTPLGAMALFGGTYFNSRWKSYLFPLLALFASDMVMMQLFYKTYSNGLLYNGWLWTYSAFAVMVLIGKYVKKVNFKSVVTAAVTAALAHWLITDFGVWLGGGLDVTTGRALTADWHGFVQCYVQAIPFLKNMLLGNIIYSGILYGGFEALQKRYPSLRLRAA
ncbi:MAG: hypothetical protein M0Q26_03875 [Chitinophagaceae bacterium]|nr:hypothetical protein [Chitinophagaceae bacterium]MDP1763556.1 hypothetical protein [Sediminibacterium sp.]MDP1811293.1 hypothetical protein [Sediminibacterium sp.]MDP3128028.1 hypothetical protein [Sediminibacterium sp.]MDP3665983.1 hypothetical protein [Sediminibacterium sp.]